MVDSSLGMSARQQKAAAAICLFAVFFVTCGLSWLFVAIVLGPVTGDQPPGRWLLLLIHNSMVTVIGKSIPLILGIGAACLAQYNTKDWLFYSTICLCATGVVLSLLCAIALVDPAVASEIYLNSPIEGLAAEEPYNDAIAAFFVPLGLWLVGTLSVQLRIKLGSKDAVTAATPTGSFPPESASNVKAPAQGENK